jgi:hypothetical protein
MQNKKARIGATLTALACSIGGLAMAAPATAAQSEMPIMCAGQQLIVRTNNNSSSDMGGWGAAQVVSGGSGHLIPTTFDGTFYDATIDQTIFTFSQAKGGGNGNHNLQPTAICTDTQTGTLGDFLEPGDIPPPGSSPSDSVVFTIRVTGAARG